MEDSNPPTFGELLRNNAKSFVDDEIAQETLWFNDNIMKPFLIPASLKGKSNMMLNGPLNVIEYVYSKMKLYIELCKRHNIDLTFVSSFCLTPDDYEKRVYKPVFVW